MWVKGRECEFPEQNNGSGRGGLTDIGHELVPFLGVTGPETLLAPLCRLAFRVGCWRVRGVRKRSGAITGMVTAGLAREVGGAVGCKAVPPNPRNHTRALSYERVHRTRTCAKEGGRKKGEMWRGCARHRSRARGEQLTNVGLIQILPRELVRGARLKEPGVRGLGELLPMRYADKELLSLHARIRLLLEAVHIGLPLLRAEKRGDGRPALVLPVVIRVVGAFKRGVRRRRRVLLRRVVPGLRPRRHSEGVKESVRYIVVAGTLEIGIS